MISEEFEEEGIKTYAIQNSTQNLFLELNRGLTN
jgi:hypothetical protein